MPETSRLPQAFQDVDTFIFDCDGVITSEEGYFDAAGLTIREILESPLDLGLSPPDYAVVPEVFYRRMNALSRDEMRKYLSREFIVAIKSRGLNSNWDLAFVVIGIYLGDLLGEAFQALQRDDVKALYEFGLLPDTIESWRRTAQAGNWEEVLRLDQLASIGTALRDRKLSVTSRHELHLQILDDFHPDVRGLEILQELNRRLPTARHDPGQPPIGPFARPSPFWTEVMLLFQEWYLGDELFEKVYGNPIRFGPKPGLIHHEEPLLGVTRTEKALRRMKEAGFKLGIATGRPKWEVLTPFAEWSVRDYFDENHFGTHDRVEDAEQELQAHGRKINLSKPDPFILLRAIHPNVDTLRLVDDDALRTHNHHVAYVGDTVADVWAGRAAGCPTVAVLSGASGILGRKQIEEAQPDLIVQDLYELAKLIAG